MRKEVRMFAGIILHPVRAIFARIRRNRMSYELRNSARARTWEKNHERMHHFSSLTNTGFTESPLYGNLYAGAPE